MYNPYENEGLYIAGPECFYQRGYSLWYAQRKLAEYYGIPVVLPTSTDLKLDSIDKKDNAREIFDDLIVQVSRTTVIIADLESFRGYEPDGGTVFELGWVYSKGGRLYGYSRDCRQVLARNHNASIVEGKVLDEYGVEQPYGDMPFCPSVMATTQLIEGDFLTALKLMLSELGEERKHGRRKRATVPAAGIKGDIYYSPRHRYDSQAGHDAETVKRRYADKGLTVLTPFDVLPGYPEPDTSDPLRKSVWRTLTNLALIDACNAIVADLNNFRGLEPSNDVSFECGYAWGKGKRCHAFMEDASIMKERIPKREDGFDSAGNTIENFDLPVNLMFGTYFHIAQGGVDLAISKVEEG